LISALSYPSIPAQAGTHVSQFGMPEKWAPACAGVVLSIEVKGKTQMTSVGLPPAEKPEQVGLSSERLDRITATVRADVEARRIPGAVLAIARGGRTLCEAIGYRDREAEAR